MLLTVFHTRLNPGAGPEAEALGTRMYEIATSMPGFVSYREFQGADGESVSLVEFASPETLAAWRNHPEHLQAQQIGYVNAHATATAGGDPVEAAALREVLDDVPVSSTKAIHGHLLGAASAMELAVAILAVNKSLLPATAHLDSIDPACALNHVANTPIFDHPVEHALSLSAGFGGTNVALIVSRENSLPSKALKTTIA